MTPSRLPHSEIPGSPRAYRSPRLIAVCRVLHRLRVPRHPLYALTCLTLVLLYEGLSIMPLSKNRSCLSNRNRIRSTSKKGSETWPPLTRWLALPRKEVIQPQVPLRLPCYDFTPITLHTLGAYLPEGLAQRLLVHTAFVV
jgi:hypothetical protein